MDTIVERLTAVQNELSSIHSLLQHDDPIITFIGSAIDCVAEARRLETASQEKALEDYLEKWGRKKSDETHTCSI